MLHISSTPQILNFIQETDFISTLQVWVGEKIFNRGIGYFKKKLVNNIVITPDGKIIGTVSGTRNYISALYLDNDKLASTCTCPYDGICKHVAALGLAARGAVLEKKTLPACDEFDFRLAKLRTLYLESTPLIDPIKLKEALSKLPKEILLELLLKACDLDSDILLLCATKADPGKIGIQAMLNDARNSIAEAACAPDFDDEYSSKKEHSAIAKKLHAIIVAGKPEIALDLATEVFNTCSNAIEVYDHDGEIIGDVGEVAKTAVIALRDIDWTLAKKMTWAINVILQDDFGYSEWFETYLHEISDPSAWSDIAQYLDTLQPFHFGGWGQSKLLDLRKLALKNANRCDDLLKLYEDEAKEKNDYLKLVDYLLEHGKTDDAEKWIKRGLETSKSAYDARNLRKRLVQIREKEEDYDAIITLQTEIFVDFPDVKEYEACMKTAKLTKHWDVLKSLLALYLTDGKLPWLEGKWPFQNKGIAKSAPHKFPLYLELTELAMFENRPLDALKWYDEQRKNKRGYGVQISVLPRRLKM